MNALTFSLCHSFADSGGYIPSKLAQVRSPGRLFNCASLLTPKA